MWAPNRVPPFPADYHDLKEADDSLCDSTAEMNVSPNATQFSAATDGLEVIIYPANAINQAGTDPSGVCVSTDGAQSLTQVPFPDANNDDGYGPQGVYWADSDRCFAFAGREFASDSFFVYYTHDASAGAEMFVGAGGGAGPT